MHRAAIIIPSQQIQIQNPDEALGQTRVGKRVQSCSEQGHTTLAEMSVKTIVMYYKQ